MVIVCGIYQLRLDECFSLKEKRMVTKSLIQRVRNKFNASCSETGLNDSFNDIEISCAVVNSSQKVAESQMQHIGDFIYNNAEAELISEEMELIHL